MILQATRSSKRIVITTIILTLVLIFAAMSIPDKAWAKTDESDPAGSLQVYLGNSDGTNLVHDYSYAEMVNLDCGYNESYSSIDSLPICVYTVAHGVFLNDLINDAKSYNSGVYMDYGVKIKLYGTDGWNCTYTYNDLFGNARYYYPSLFTTWDSVNGEAGDGADVDPRGSRSHAGDRFLPGQNF